MLRRRTCEGEKVEVTFGKKEKEKRNNQGKDQGPLMKIAKVVKPVHLKQRAKERTQEPSKNQLKGGGF